MDLKQSILDAAAREREAIAREPFVEALAAGRAPDPVVARWAREDLWFVRGLRRAVGRLMADAPDEAAVDLLAGAVPVLADECARLAAQATALGADPEAPADPLTVRFVNLLREAAAAGFGVGIAPYWAAEAAYLEAWTGVRERIGLTGPYAPWIENWTSAGFAAFVDALGRLVDAYGDPGAGAALAAEVFVLEREFWRMCWEGPAVS